MFDPEAWELPLSVERAEASVLQKGESRHFCEAPAQIYLSRVDIAISFLAPDGGGSAAHER